jgi:hypothetical protein
VLYRRVFCPASQRTNWLVTAMGSLGIRRQLVWVATSLVGGIVIVSVLLAVLAAKYGSITAGNAYLRGEPLLLMPQTLDVGTELEKQQRTYRLELVNLSEGSIRILGVKPSCNCIAVEDELPIEIPGRGSHFLTLTVNFVGKLDQFQHSVVAFSDVAQGGIATATIIGRVQRAPEND